MTSSTPTKSKSSTKTKAAWTKKGIHENVTLPSGMEVDIRLPNLSQLIKAGEIPNPLIDAAISFQTAETVTREMLEQSFDFAVWILPRTVINPEITEEDVRNGEIPAEDIDLLAAFVARTTDLDAVGNHLGGLESNAAFRRFRQLENVDEIAERLR
jgi:hypothetical protein